MFHRGIYPVEHWTILFPCRCKLSFSLYTISEAFPTFRLFRLLTGPAQCPPPVTLSEAIPSPQSGPPMPHAKGRLLFLGPLHLPMDEKIDGRISQLFYRISALETLPRLILKILQYYVTGESVSLIITNAIPSFES